MSDLSPGPIAANPHMPAVSTAAQAVRRNAQVSMRRQMIVAGCILLALAALPFLVSSFELARYNVALIFIMAAIGFNLAYGFAGQFVLGHAAVMAVSAYATGIACLTLQMSPGMGLLFGIGVGVVFGMCIMTPGVRITGWYLAFITLFAVLILPAVTQIFPGVSGGSDGLSGIPSFALFGKTFPAWAYYELVLSCVAMAWLGSACIAQSRLGLRLRALRDAPRAARTVGMDLIKTRLLAYFISSVPAAVAGVLVVFVERFVQVDTFGPNLALLLLTGVVLGGAGTVWGPVLGMAPLVGITFWVGTFSPYNAITLGVALLAGVLIFPEGFAPVIANRFGRRRTGAPTPPAGSASHPAIAGKTAVRRTSPPVDVQGRRVVLSVRDIQKSFGGVQALRGVRFDLRQGLLCGLVGPNGCGKSTLLNVLSGFIKPDNGAVEILDVRVTGWDTARIARAGVGRTFQIPETIGDLNVLDNIALGLNSVVFTDGRQQRLRVLETFALLGLPVELMDVSLAEVPLGFKRLIEVGRAIVSQPKLLMLDEPAAGLNDAERQKLSELLVTLRNGGMSILVVEHDVHFVLNTCDELIFMELGEISARASLSSETLPERLRQYLAYGLDDGDSEHA